MDLEITTYEEEEADYSSDEDLPQNTTLVIERMEEAWLNEKFAPEILPHKYVFVEILLLQISNIEEKLKERNTSDLEKPLFQMESERLRFIITSYLRLRLEKIETYAFIILKQEEERKKRNQNLYLTEREAEFANAYIESLNQHFEDVLQFWPILIPNNWKNDLIQPDMHSFVFFRSKKKLDNIMIDGGRENDEDVVDLDIGSQAIIPYESIMHLVTKGDICLI